ncbi:hypothetical protein SBA6_680001 [Candidatus Sulfopaludibacter sp. SbA6]|nr:hypothetical protein SBA6_680001 [Candidatus Sulfopaludibacter sp. SbA6]
MAAATKPRRGAAKCSGEKKTSNSRPAVDFAPGSLEADISAIGKAVPAREWAKVPGDYFANLDRYLHSAPKKK